MGDSPNIKSLAKHLAVAAMEGGGAVGQAGRLGDADDRLVLARLLDSYGVRVGAAEPLFEGRVEGIDWADGIGERHGQARVRPSVTVVSLVGEDVHPLTYYQGVEVALYRKGDVPAVPESVRARPEADAERLRDLLDDTVGAGLTVDQCRVLLDTGLARLPEPPVRWTVDGYDVRDSTLGALNGTVATCFDRDVAERIARLLNEEDERG